jgi:hypothetical protein
VAGFRLTNGSSGCPPTETPPSDYEIPFRFDSAGRLWLKSCFQGFEQLGAARHDISSNSIFGTASVPIGGDITAGTYANFNVVNDTACDLGILLAYDLSADLYVSQDSLAQVTLSGRWNGVTHSSIAVSSIYIDSGDTTGGIRVIQTAAAAPHDAAIDAGGAASLVVTPGNSATVSCRLSLSYIVGTSDGIDQFNSANSVVRVYGYVIP